MMAANWAGVCSRDWLVTTAFSCWLPATGSWPSWPDAIWAFWAVTALTTSVVVRL